MGLPVRTQDDERGAILVHVVFTLLFLIAFSAFTIDYGVLWASRRQAQNSADAAALAGAVAFIKDPAKDTTDTGSSKLNALAMSQVNLVWGQSPAVNIATDITFPLCPDDASANCIRVDAYRTLARGNPLPIFFGQFFGLVNHDIRASATAKVITANSTNCMKPWAVPDLFTDVNGNGEYDAGDVYDPGEIGPPIDPGTGYSTAPEEEGGHYGVRVVLKNGPHTQISPGWFSPLDFGAGGSTYEDAIAGCVETEYGIGDVVPTETGNMQGPTQDGLSVLIDKDPEAYWDDELKKIIDSCAEDGADGDCPGFDTSPRVVPVPVYDPAEFAASDQKSVKISKILGFFVECVNEAKADCENPVDPSDYPPDFDPKFDVLGILINVPGLYSGSKGPAGPGTFLQTVILVR
jgi:hypothetical protein